jgi:hypothetical protein
MMLSSTYSTPHICVVFCGGGCCPRSSCCRSFFLPCRKPGLDLCLIDRLHYCRGEGKNRVRVTSCNRGKVCSPSALIFLIRVCARSAS